MGNLMKLGSGEVGPCGLAEAHGVLHRVSSHDFALLSGMEHEYRCRISIPVCRPCGKHFDQPERFP